MARPFNLQPLLEIMQERADEATRRLGQLIAQEQSAKSRLQLIEQYREEYAERFRAAAAAGLSPQAWQNYTDFLARIDQAIAQQKLAVLDSERGTAQGKARWHEQNKKLKAIDTLADRHETRERYRENKQEQKQLDEYVNRKFGARDTD